MSAATDTRPASREMEEFVITHDPESTYYAVMLGHPERPGHYAVAGYHLRLKDAVRAADPAGDRVWEDPTEVTDRELHPDAILFSRRKKA